MPGGHDAWALAYAVAASIGAWWAAPLPRWLGALAVVSGFAVRRPAVLLAGLVALAAGLGAAAWAGVAPVAVHPVAGVVTLVSDPESQGVAQHALVRSAEGRLDLWAGGRTAGALAGAAAGERVVVEGRAGPVGPQRRERLATQHVRGTLSAESVRQLDGGSLAARSANAARALLARGARVLPARERALFTGFVVGDDRAVDRPTTLAFRAAGLAHLTAVSGQNLTLLMVLVAPLLGRLPIRARAVATVAVVGWFVLVTRAEPSVLRAAGMAVVGALGTGLARPASPARALGLAVAALVLVDPLLVYRAGWWLSVAATAGIVLVGPPLARSLPLPRTAALAVAVPVAAQLGTLPVQLLVFGTIAPAGLVANLLAEPVAGPVMVAGVPLAALSSFLPDAPARAVMAPVLAGVRWIDLVARTAAALPTAAGIALGAASVAAVVGGLAVGRHAARERSACAETPAR